MILFLAALVPFSEPQPVYFLDIELEKNELSKQVVELLGSQALSKTAILNDKEILLAARCYFNQISREDCPARFGELLSFKEYISHQLRYSANCDFLGVQIIVELIKMSKKIHDHNPYCDPKLVEVEQNIHSFCHTIFKNLEDGYKDHLMNICSEDDSLFFYVGNFLCKNQVGAEYYYPSFKTKASEYSSDKCFQNMIVNFNLDELTRLYRLLNEAEQMDFLKASLLAFDYRELARAFFKEVLPKDNVNAHFALCKHCYENKRPHLIEVLFALVPKFYKHSVITRLKESGYLYAKPLPGRLGSEEVYFVQFGDAETYFFMDLEKYEAARKAVEDTNEKSMLGICAAEFPLPTIEVSSIATINDEPIGFNRNHEPIFVDDRGTRAVEKYSKGVREKIDERLGLKMLAPSRQMSLVLSHDAMRFHQDQLPLQYAYLNQKGVSFPKCYLTQDLTLMDWDMSDGTLSGTLIQDGPLGDRFYLTLLPGEVTTNVTLDPPIYPTEGSAPVYLGPTTLPPHSATAPIDVFGALTAGSSKGKRISYVVRGVVLEDDLQYLHKNALHLNINRPTIKEDGDDVLYQYKNEICRKEFFLEDLPLTTYNALYRLPSKENIEILSGDISNGKVLADLFSHHFHLDLSHHKLEFYKLIKRDSGFTELSALGMSILPDSMVVVINRSHLPQNYDYYPLSEDCMVQGLPWIQMYRLSPNSILKCYGETFMNLTLTPLEELFHRNAKFDAKSLEVPYVPNQFTTEIDIFVFSKI